MICWTNQVKTQDGEQTLEEFLKSSSDVDWKNIQYPETFYDKVTKTEKIEPTRISNFWIALNDDFHLINEKNEPKVVDGVYYYKTLGFCYRFYFDIDGVTKTIDAGLNQKILMYDGSWKSLIDLTIGKDYAIVRSKSGDRPARYLGVLLHISKKNLMPHFTIHLENSAGIQIGPGFVLSCNHSL